MYVANRLGYIFPNLIQFYLSDLLAVPVIATLSLWLMRWLLSQQNFVLVYWQLIFIIMMCSIIFEVLLPYFMERYVSDSVDVLMYLLGGGFFWKVMNKPSVLLP
ncbi:hypothetical protein [Pedobacter sp. Hv1]|uniref:hypothetical protein n=1 Tax=Pedobacter sp. Hv1 TaxID=1740090 RepID=UPI00128F2E1F|nr:hypothetical protein [Pedobacter sp. Hv1]